ncbi:MAG: hypothetical protein NWF07_08100, partial [Candidatus Bathyarchaeota archaeon]|nr:hypothetical protein [Candidatus Bathyarchaeota archaeon]
TEQGFTVDLWRHSSISYQSLFETEWVPSEIFQRTMFLNILQNCIILYDQDQIFTGYQSRAQNWVWPQENIDYFLEKSADAERFYNSQELDGFEKLLFTKSLVLLDTCVDLMKLGKPVSNRVKDLYLKSREQLKDNRIQSVYSTYPSHEELDKLIRESFAIFHEEISDRDPFTELTDAEKHHTCNEDFLAAISLQNGAYYLGRYGLRRRNIELENQSYLFSETHVELAKITKKQWRSFYEYSRRIHGFEN